VNFVLISGKLEGGESGW